MENGIELCLSEIRNKKVLITGATGFIGSRVAGFLVEKGAQVFGTSRFEQKGTDENVTWLRCSLTSLEEVEALLAIVKPDLIYHFSGQVTGSTDLKHVSGTFHSLVTSTVNLLVAATRLGGGNPARPVPV